MKIELKMIGDWGVANFHTLLGIVAANMRKRCEPGSKFWIRTGTGYRENVDAVATGEVDMGITTPFDVTLEWARTGRHFFAGTAYPQLRTLGHYPQDDRLVFAVRADTGITSFDDIRERKYPLRLATTPRDPDNMMSWVVEEILKIHGIDPDDIERWGGKWLGDDRPVTCVLQALTGTADAVFYEGIMVPAWYELVAKVPMRFIPLGDKALTRLKTEYGLRPAILPKGRLGVPNDIACLDWSHWAAIIREDMDDELAYLLTAVLVEHRGEMEAKYRHIPVERSPMTYPVDPHTMWKGLGAPLHPGAARYYREHGYMP